MLKYLVFSITLAAGGWAASPRAADAPKPNILLIISDDHAWTDYGFMGHPQIKTPRLDRLAAESLLFPRGYVPSSLCCPSLATIITGLFPHQHGVVCNDPPGAAGQGKARQQFYASPAFREGREKMSAFLEKVPTLPRLLQKHGYVSLQTGKWWQNHYSRGGFTHGMTQGEADKGGRHGDAGLQIGRKTMQPIWDFVDEATRDKKPFLIWYAPLLPHDPHTPPDRLLAKYKDSAPTLHIARYWAMVEWFDETCGQLLDFLDQRGLATNTVVAYLADNGWIQSPDNPRYAPKSKQSQYDGGLRTPIMLRWPGKIAPRRVETPVSSVDLMPTLLAACGVAAPPGLPGLNLMEDKAVAARSAVTGACFTHDGVDLDRPGSGLRWRWIVSGDWKLIVPNPANEPDAVTELYKITTDVREESNLAEREPVQVQRLRAQLDAWWPGRP